MRAAGASLALLAFLTASCGQELLGVEIGCEWFEGQNCWKESLEALGHCTHDIEQKGALKTDGSACTFDDGTEIVFHNPVKLDQMNTHLWDFEIFMDGSLCMSFKEPSTNKRILATSLGTYVEKLINLGVQFNCPDGSRYKVPNASALGTCEDYKDILPGISSAWSDSALMFSLTGGEDGVVHIFSCQQE